MLIRLRNAVLRLVFRLIVSLAIIIVILAGALTVYFRHISHFRQTIMQRVSAEINQYHVHELQWSQLPDMYREAVIATEDRRFAWDPGIDPIGMVRSLVVDVGKDGYIQGGSTITQQLVDNTILSRRQSLAYKLEQIFYAIGIYDTFTKHDTFAMYANLIYFGHGAYGLYNASETYFDKQPNELNNGELTMLAGIPNAPSVYDPFRNLALARRRQAIVLDNMVNAGVLTRGEANAIFNQPIALGTP